MNTISNTFGNVNRWRNKVFIPVAKELSKELKKELRKQLHVFLSDTYDLVYNIREMLKMKAKNIKKLIPDEKNVTQEALTKGFIFDGFSVLKKIQTEFRMMMLPPEIADELFRKIQYIDVGRIMSPIEDEDRGADRDGADSGVADSGAAVPGGYYRKKQTRKNRKLSGIISRY